MEEIRRFAEEAKKALRLADKIKEATELFDRVDVGVPYNKETADVAFTRMIADVEYFVNKIVEEAEKMEDDLK